MSFTAAQLVAWLGGDVRVWRADGQPWTDDGALAGITMQGATLDSRQIRDATLFLGVAGEHTHGGRFLGRALQAGAPVALLEGERPTEPDRGEPVLVVDDARTALARITRGYLATFAPRVVAITGSNGKTTTKDFLRVALAGTHSVGANPGNLNSGWGLPVAVLGQRGDESVLVLEMGASQPGEIARLTQLAPPWMSCVTNIAPAHLEGFGSVEGVVETKSALLDALPEDGVAILPADDDHYDALARRAGPRRIITFGRGEKADVRITACRQDADGLFVAIDGEEARLPLFGEANANNVAAACAMAAQLGVSAREALDRMAAVELSPHRSRLLRVADRTVLDDCYNANPRSVAAALHSLASLPTDGARWAVLGSMAELGDDEDRYHRETVALARDLGVDHLVAVGDLMREAVHTTWATMEAPERTATELGRDLAARSRAEDALLFKGSRSVALERVLEAMLTELEPAGNGV